jgi:hypothetical protein
MIEVSPEVVGIQFMGSSGTSATAMSIADALGYLRNTASRRQLIEPRLLQFSSLDWSGEGQGNNKAFAVI